MQLENHLRWRPWVHFTKAAIAKGPKSIRLTKVKGHVTTQQVLDNIYRGCDKKGNDKADHAADLAVKMHGDDAISVANILHARHRKCTNLKKDVVRKTYCRGLSYSQGTC